MNDSHWQQYQELLLLIERKHQYINHLMREMVLHDDLLHLSTDLLRENEQLDKLICKRLKMQQEYELELIQPKYFYHPLKKPTDPKT